MFLFAATMVDTLTNVDLPTLIQYNLEDYYVHVFCLCSMRPSNVLRFKEN